MLSQERSLTRIEKGEGMAHPKATELHTDVECRELVLLGTMTTITECKISSLQGVLEAEEKN